MFYAQDRILIPDPRKSKGKHAVCLPLPKYWYQNQSRSKYPAGFFVKGNIQRQHFKMVKLIELEDKAFLFPIPGNIRRKLKLKAGDTLYKYEIKKDRLYYGMHNDFLMVFFEEPREVTNFYVLLNDMDKHRYHEWIWTARTEDERVNRIAKVIDAMRNKQTFKEMRKG
jgi:hypothetical protein